MSDLNVHWFLPTAGDSRDVEGTGSAHHRTPTIDYLGQVARAVDDLGFRGILTPVGTWCENPWIVTTQLAAMTKQLRYIVAIRPGETVPTLIAQMSSAYQHATGNRLILNVVSGGEESELHRFGDWLDKESRYARTGEFLEILRGSFEGPFDFKGEYFNVEGASAGAVPAPIPEIHFGGASPPAEKIAAKYADVHHSWGEPLEAMKERIDRLSAMARENGRELRFGLRIHAISRDDADEAWAETDRLIAQMDPKVIEKTVEAQRNSQAEGQRRMAELHGGSTDGLVIGPNLWAGIGLVRGGAGTALVGSHEEIADRIEEYHEIGITELILSGHPHLEEAYAVGEGLLPVLRERGLVSGLSDAASRERGPGYISTA